MEKKSFGFTKTHSPHGFKRIHLLWKAQCPYLTQPLFSFSYPWAFILPQPQPQSYLLFAPWLFYGENSITLPFLLYGIHINLTFILHQGFSVVIGDSQCMLYCFFHFCLTFAPHPSSLYQSNAQTTSLSQTAPLRATSCALMEEEAAWGEASAWGFHLHINGSEVFSGSFYVNTLQNMFCTALSPEIKTLESEFGCQFYWCCMGYSRIQLSLLEIYWLGSAESNKTVFLISKPRGYDSRRNIGSKHAIVRQFLPHCPCSSWMLC